MSGADNQTKNATPDWIAGWNAACEDFAAAEERHAMAYEKNGDLAEAALAYMRAKDAKAKKRI